MFGFYYGAVLVLVWVLCVCADIYVVILRLDALDELHDDGPCGCVCVL